jgi:phosphopantothenoylcysteine decarboxylase/phosphopantothenate--cysteine ligase
MGFALASEAARRGARVTVVAANVALARSPGIEYVDVETAAELRTQTLARFDRCDLLLMAAAVADFRPADPHDGKIAKQGRSDLELRLVATGDVLSELAERRRSGQTLVGFAAEHGERGAERARVKLECKGLDAIVFNDISRPDIGFDSEDNEVTIVTPDSEREVARSGKGEVAAAILDFVGRLRARGEAATPLLPGEPTA